MRNIKLVLEYDGANYCGWQIQKSHKAAPRMRSGQAKSQSRPAISIQESIEKVLSKILQEKIRLNASGRTDAGVHALAQVANFNTNSRIELKRLQRALNALLPDDISVIKAEDALPDFHSRFNAESKLYRYTILNRPYRSVFLKNRAYFYPYPLDLKLMQNESRVLLGKHDFSSFRASGSSAKDSIRTIKKLKITRAGDFIHIHIEAEGFLYNMVRNIVGTLIEIGRGKFAKGSLKKILQARNRRNAGPTVPACGLYLERVKYIKR